MSANSINMHYKNAESNKTVVKNLSFINPEAADSNVALFCTTLNNQLTDNTLIKLEKVQKSDLEIPQI